MPRHIARSGRKIELPSREWSGVAGHAFPDRNSIGGFPCLSIVLDFRAGPLLQRRVKHDGGQQARKAKQPECTKRWGHVVGPRRTRADLDPDLEEMPAALGAMHAPRLPWTLSAAENLRLSLGSALVFVSIRSPIDRYVRVEHLDECPGGSRRAPG